MGLFSEHVILFMSDEEEKHSDSIADTTTPLNSGDVISVITACRKAQVLCPACYRVLSTSCDLP